MANRNTKRRIRALRKAGDYFHGEQCNTKGKGCNFPQPKMHPYIAAVEALMKARGR